MTPPQALYRPRPVPLSPGGQPLADFGTRLLAYLIDTMIASAAGTVILTPVFLVYFFTQFADMSTTAVDADALVDMLVPLLLLFLAGTVLMLVLYYIYYVEMMHRSGQTIGKKALGIKVVPADPSRTLTRGMAAKRYLVEFVAGGIVPFVSYVDGLWQLWDKPYQQTLHDRFAQTVVIKVSA